MSDLTARAIADLKAELAESKAEANKVTQSMGSEILRLQCELEQQRTRAEAAEQELREYTELVFRERKEVEGRLAAARARAEAAEQEAAELAGVIRDVSAMLAQAQEMLK